MLDQVAANSEPVHSLFDVESDLARRDALDKPPHLPLADAIRHATAETGSGTAWLSGFWRCMNGPGNLSASEYFYYNLYSNKHSEHDVLRFVGKTAQAKMHAACCDPKWFAAALDKQFFLTVMQGAGVPIPETLVIYDPSGQRSHPRQITRPDALHAFMDDPANYPMFAKPVDGMYSVGVMAMTDGGDGWAHVKGVGQVRIDEIVDYMSRMSAQGYLLQKTLIPHEQLADAFGAALGTVRFLVLVGDDGPVIESAVAKIPSGDNIADNYWRDGNMLGAIDPEDGTLMRVVSGVGAAFKEVETHPTTGVEMLGLTLPEWHAATSMCLRAAGTLPGLHTQSWDIALTNRGPVALEVNWGGDLNLHQLAHNQGVLSPSFVDHLKNNGYKGKLPV